MAKTKKAKRFPNSRKQYLTPIVLALVILGFGLIGISHLAKSGASSVTGRLCNSNGYCASLPAGGSVFNLEGVEVIPSSGAWRWNEVSDFTVNSSYPFQTGWLNTAYGGKPVVIYQLYANKNYCMANDGTFVVIRACANTPAQRWVKSGGWRVNVAASDNHNARYVLTKVNSQAMTQHGGDYAPVNQNWSLYR